MPFNTTLLLFCSWFLENNIQGRGIIELFLRKLFHGFDFSSLLKLSDLLIKTCYKWVCYFFFEKLFIQNIYVFEATKEFQTFITSPSRYQHQQRHYDEVLLISHLMSWENLCNLAIIFNFFVFTFLVLISLPKIVMARNFLFLMSSMFFVLDNVRFFHTGRKVLSFVKLDMN